MRDLTFLQLETATSNLQRVVAMVRDDGNTALASNGHIQIIKHFDQLRQVNGQLKDLKKALDELADAFSREHVPEIMREQGVKTITVEGVGRVSVSHRFSCSIIAKDKTEGHNWLRDNSYGDLVTETVNSSTLSAFARDLIENEGKELPGEIFKTSTMAFTSITKAK